MRPLVDCKTVICLVKEVSGVYNLISVTFCRLAVIQVIVLPIGERVRHLVYLIDTDWRSDEISGVSYLPWHVKYQKPKANVEYLR